MDVALGIAAFVCVPYAVRHKNSLYVSGAILGIVTGLLLSVHRTTYHHRAKFYILFTMMHSHVLTHLWADSLPFSTPSTIAYLCLSIVSGVTWVHQYIEGLDEIPEWAAKRVSWVLCTAIAARVVSSVEVNQRPIVGLVLFGAYCMDDMYDFVQKRTRKVNAEIQAMERRADAQALRSMSLEAIMDRRPQGRIGWRDPQLLLQDQATPVELLRWKCHNFSFLTLTGLSLAFVLWLFADDFGF